MKRVEAGSAEELLSLVRDQRLENDAVNVTAVVPSGLDDDQLLALCAMLANAGVASIECDQPRVAKRSIDTYRVLSGAVEIEAS